MATPLAGASVGRGVEVKAPPIGRAVIHSSFAANIQVEQGA